jgi:hypothetical protein
MSKHEPASEPRRRARLIRLASVSAEREIGVVASLAQRPGSSALVIADLVGDAATLGRFQHPGRSNATRELRRLTGGRSTRYGDGVVSLCALAPTAQAWLDETGALSGPRLLNRLVRGLLAGLARLGLAASYPGRDFVTVNGRRVAYVSLSREASGVFLFQAVLGVGAAYTTAERDPSWPGLPAAPEPTWLARERMPAPDFDRIASALAAGFAERFALVLEDAPLSSDEERAFAAASVPPLVDASLAELTSAGAVATPIGELGTHVALDRGGRLARVRLRGDWIAAPPELQALEAALVGELPESPNARELCAAWLATPAALVIGLTDAATLADSVARSARAYSVASNSSSSA